MDAYRFEALARRDPEMAAELRRFWWRPFDDRRIALLTAWQRSGRFHPYTCGEDGHPPLAAWIAGWRCEAPGCAYTQDWAHPIPDEVAADLLGGAPTGAAAGGLMTGRTSADGRSRPFAESSRNPREVVARVLAVRDGWAEIRPGHWADAGAVVAELRAAGLLVDGRRRP